MKRFIRAMGVVGLGTSVLVGCSQDDPFSDEGGADGSGDGTDTGADGATSADPTGADGGPGSSGGGSTSNSTDPTGNSDTAMDCPPIPTRMIVLGDSIPFCFGAGTPASATCSVKILHDHISTNVAPTTYENLSVGGAVTEDIVTSQLGRIEVGKSGHALVSIFIGGNDLADFIFEGDQAAMDGYATLRVELDGYWDQIYAFVEDPANFPDGATMMMNTQYNPFDDCTAEPYPTMTQVKTDLLHDYNDDLVAKSDARDYVWIADHHTPFLGHGHHFENSTCPHYAAGSEGWMFDLIHANVPGHAALAAAMAQVADEMYSCY